LVLTMGKTLAPGDAHRREQRKKEVAKNKLKRKTQRDEALETASVESLEAELRKIEDAKRLGVASNEKVQRVKALEDAIARQREQRKSEAAPPPQQSR